jgi:hypothetical protein
MKQNIRVCTTVDSVRLAYAVSGEGPPLVMSATWLTHLEHQWRSLAWRPWLDAFGLGRTQISFVRCGLRTFPPDSGVCTPMTPSPRSLYFSALASQPLTQRVRRPGARRTSPPRVRYAAAPGLRGN